MRIGGNYFILCLLFVMLNFLGRRLLFLDSIIFILSLKTFPTNALGNLLLRAKNGNGLAMYLPKKCIHPHPCVYFYVVVCVFLCVPGVTAQDLATIFKKHIENLGGAEKLQKVTTVTMTGTAINEWNGAAEKAISYRKVPYLSRYEGIIGTDTTFACFDGQKSCLGSKPERPAISRIAQMQKENTKVVKPNEGVVSNFLLFEGQHGNVTAIQTDSCIVYEVTFEDSMQVGRFYIDSKHFFIQKHTLLYKEVGSNSIQLYENYREFDGIFFPTKIISWLELDGYDFARKTSEYTTIKLNKALDTALFRCP